MFNQLIKNNAELGRFLFCERYTLHPVKNAMYIAEGQDLKRGAVVDVNGYLIGTEGLQPYAVLENDCDTRFGGKQASVFIVGEFNFDKLFFADGLNNEQLDNIVYNARKIGIIIKPYSFSLDFVPQDDYEPGKVADGGILTDGAVVSVPNNSVSKLSSSQAALTLDVECADSEVPNFAVEITAGAAITLTVTKTVGLTTTTLNPSAVGGNSLERGKFYQVTCVGSCWTLAEFIQPTP